VRAGWLALSFLLVGALGARADDDFAAGEKPFSQASPDGKWLFEANWYGGDTSSGGYLSDIKEVATGHVAFADEKPKAGENDVLPRRMFIAWSPDSRYIIVNYYYGRALFGGVVLALDGQRWIGVNLPNLGHPRHMIHPKDRGRWTAGGEILVSLGPWGDNHTLTATDTMRATMTNSDGSSQEIESERTRTLQINGTKAKVIATTDPEY
jgi:hypothetical protein